MGERPYRTDPDWFAERAEGLLASAGDGTAGPLAAFARAGAPLTPDGARAALAAAHGEEDWAALLARVAALDASSDPLLLAYRAIEAHDLDALRALLDGAPELTTVVGTNGNDLLGLAAAGRDDRLVALLLERGADPARGNVHGWTALHQAASSGAVELTRRLLAAGAPLDGSARGEGGTPLVVALFWGKRATAELVAAADGGLVPANLRVAAGLGRLDLIEALVAPDGQLAPAAGAGRAFYRPHGGFPAWRPGSDATEVRDEALAWAARNDRADAIELLAARGADLEADVYRGTPLAWAAARGATAALERLLALGADPNGRGSFGGPGHGEGVTALHLAAGDGRVEAAAVLLAGGADPTLRDRLFDATPAGWAEHGGHAALAARLEVAGG